MHLYIIYALCIHTHTHTHIHIVLRWLSGKESTCQRRDTGDTDWILGSGRYPGEGNGNPLQYSCLENPWTEEAEDLQSMGLQRVGHDLVTKQCVCICSCTVN